MCLHPPHPSTAVGVLGLGAAAALQIQLVPPGASVASPTDTSHSTSVTYLARLLTSRQLDKSFN